MKFMLLALGLCASQAFAGSITITSKEGGQKAANLGIPSVLMGIMIESGLTFTDQGNGIHKISLAEFHCDLKDNSRGDASVPEAGISTIKCRKNAENKRDTTKGQVLRSGRSIWNVLSSIQTQTTAVYFEDCAMGYCGIYAKSIECTVDTKIDEILKGRFSCTLDDGN